MRIILLIILLLTFSECNHGNTTKSLVKEIDNIKKLTESYEIEIDSSNQTLDTIEYKLFKENDDGSIVYEEYPSEINMKSYYFNEELIYRTSNYDEFNSKVTASLNSDLKVVKMISIEENDGKFENLELMYKYNRNKNGKITSRNILNSSNGLELIGITYFNEDENKVNEVFIDSACTTNLINYNYEDEKLIGSTKWYRFKPNYIFEFRYNDNENLIQEITYDDGKLISKTEYKYESKNRPQTKESINFETNKKRYFKYEYK